MHMSSKCQEKSGIAFRRVCRQRTLNLTLGFNLQNLPKLLQATGCLRLEVCSAKLCNLCTELTARRIVLQRKSDDGTGVRNSAAEMHGARGICPEPFSERQANIS